MHAHPGRQPTPALVPFLKWAGGKRALVPQILQLLPAAKRLVEPFVGAGAVFAGSSFESYLLVDVNPDLANVYTRLQANPDELIRACQNVFVRRNQDGKAYMLLRRKFNACAMNLERAALFVYLNKHAFNGLCRYNRAGAFNVPIGRSKSAPTVPADAMRLWAKKLAHAEITCGDFAETLRRVKAGDVVYCDPPYLPLAERATFVQYAAGGFDWSDHQRLADLAREVARNGIPVLISNHDTEQTRALYAGARIVPVQARRSISAGSVGRGAAREILALFI